MSPERFDADREQLRLGPYLLGKRLGRGGMGDVYEATHDLMKARRFAIKLLKPHMSDSPERLQRFLREISALGSIRPHPNLVRAEFADIADGVPYLVMEHVEGIDLARLVSERGALETSEACGCILQAVEGLAVIHEAGFVHRDLKPSNLMLTPEGVVKILDLGLARLQFAEPEDRTPAECLTSSQAIVGTLDFAAPEQLDDPRGVDIRADIYSLGCTLHKLLTGKAPYADHATPSQKIRAHVSAPFPRLPHAFPGALQAALDRMTAKNPAERMATPAEVARALRPFCKDQEGNRDAGSFARVASAESVQETASRSATPSSGNAATPLENPTARFSGAATSPLQASGLRRFLLRPSGMLSAAVLICGVAAALGSASVFFRRQVEQQRFDVDGFEPLRWHSLFRHEPEKIVWSKTDRTAHTTFDPGLDHYFATTRQEAYFKMGSTERKNYKFQVTINTAAWERVGLFFAFRALPGEEIAKARSATFHYVSFGTEGDPETPILERGRGSFKRRDAEAPPVFNSMPIKAARFAPRVGDRTLEIEVTENNLVRVYLDNVPLENLREIADGPNRDDYRGAFGVFVANNSCHFRDAKFYLLPPP